MKKRVHVLVSGRVQGVFFRDSTRRKARPLGLTGFVRNLKDGTVEIIAEGEEEELKKLVDWCKQGPVFARVKEVRAKWGSHEGEFDDFVIDY